MSDNLFEKAVRRKLRFRAANGLVTTEDLYDLSLTALDTIAKALRKELRDTEESFIDAKPTNGDLELRFDVVKAVIATKIAERDARNAASAKAAEKQALLEALEAKKQDGIKNMSEEDIRKRLAELDA